MEDNFKEIFDILSNEEKCKQFCIYINKKLADVRYKLCEAHWGDNLDWFLNYSMAGDVSYSYRINTLGEMVSINIENIFYSRPENNLCTRQLLNIGVVYGNYNGIIDEQIKEYISELIWMNQ